MCPIGNGPDIPTYDKEREKEVKLVDLTEEELEAKAVDATERENHRADVEGEIV